MSITKKQLSFLWLWSMINEIWLGDDKMIELCGDDYILYIEGLDNEKLLYEMIKQAVIFNGLAQQEQVTEDDIFRYNMVVNEVYGRMEQ